MFASITHLPSSTTLKPLHTSTNDEKVTKAAEDFESMFLAQMLQHMFEGIKSDPMFGGGSAEDMYRSYMTDAIGKKMTKSGGIGLAAHVKESLLHLQEVKNHGQQ